MNAINKLSLKILYPELKDLNFDDEILEQIISNKSFKVQYKTNIKPFIKYLQKYKYSKYDNGKLKHQGLDDDIIKHHLKAVFELSIKNNSNKYILFIRKNNYAKNKITNFNIFNDSNFEALYSMIGYDVFNENISKIIRNGNSNRLIEFISNNEIMNLSRINPAMFDDKVWNIISQNPTIANKTVLELFEFKMSTLIDLINNDMFEGIEYTYKNIPESHDFIANLLGKIEEGTIYFQQFSMEFISNIGDETLKKLYARDKFSDKTEAKKIFEIASFGNYELIQDIINYDIYNFNFKNIPTSDMQKQLLEINCYNKNKVFLNKYFGIAEEDVHYIKLFLNAISKVNSLPDDFKEKYSSILQLINQILVSNDEKLIAISKTMNLDKKDEYKKLIESCEIDGNEILKNHFVNDLKTKNQQIVSTAKHKEITTKDGKNINVYELSGQPFTMLVHVIVNYKMSVNNSFVSQIINNPENWNKINGGNNHISTSLISDKYMVTYSKVIPNKNDIIMFGFNNLTYDCVKFTDISDVGIDRNASTDINYNMRNRFLMANINTVTTVDDLMEKTVELNLRKPPRTRLWNEIVLSRVDKTTGMKIKPNFVVCMDAISENSIKAAQYFNIPIYLINRKYYPELPYINDNSNDLVETQSIEETGHLKR